MIREEPRIQEMPGWVVVFRCMVGKKMMLSFYRQSAEVSYGGIGSSFLGVYTNLFLDWLFRLLFFCVFI